MSRATQGLSSPRSVKVPFLALGAMLLIGAAFLGLDGAHAPQRAEAAAAITGDLECSGDVTSSDILSVLDALVGPSSLQTEPCPDVGASVDQDAGGGFGPRTFGDVRCDGAVDVSDGLLLTRFVLGHPPIFQAEPCPDPGSVVDITGGAPVVGPTSAPPGSGGNGTAQITVVAPPGGIGSVDVSLTYNNALMTAINCTNGFGFERCNHVRSPNTARFAGVDAIGLTGTVTIGTIEFSTYTQAACLAGTATVIKATDPLGNDITLTPAIACSAPAPVPCTPPPPGNTQCGFSVPVSIGGGQYFPGGATVTFDFVTSPGNTTITPVTGPPPPPNFKVVGPPEFLYDIQTTAGFYGNFTVCIGYNPATLTGSENNVTLMHYSGGAWHNLFGAVYTTPNYVCGTAISFSVFTLMELAPVGGAVDFTTTSSSAGSPAPLLVAALLALTSLALIVTLGVRRLF